MFRLLLLAVMGIQLIVTTGTSLAESSIKVDSDLALTSDQELSNEKQIVIRVSDQSKAQRDLGLTISEGAAFDRTTSNQLNKKSAYTAILDQKNNSNQVILKQTAQTAQTAENIENDSVNRQATTFKKEYLWLLCQESGHKSTNKFDFQFKLLNLIFGGRSFSPVQILKTL